MSVQQKVKSVARKFKDTAYFYGNWAQVDEFLDHFGKETDTLWPQLPTICHILPPSGKLRPTYGATIFKDSPEALIAFLVPTSLDFNGEKNEDKVEMMKYLAALFIRALNESGYFEMIDEVDIPYQVPYDITDDNVTGVLVTLELKEIEGRSFCDDKLYNFGYRNR